MGACWSLYWTIEELQGLGSVVSMNLNPFKSFAILSLVIRSCLILVITMKTSSNYLNKINVFEPIAEEAESEVG